MLTRKEIMENLSSEINQLSQSVDNNTQISDEIISRMESLKDDLEQILTKGAKQFQTSLITGSIISTVVSSAIKNAIENRNDSPRMVIAKRIYNTLLIIGDAYHRGERNGYNATIKLLKIHNLTHDQAKHVLDLLLKQTDVLNTFEDENGQEFIMIDHDSENFQKLNDGYINNTFVYPTIINSVQPEDEED